MCALDGLFIGEASCVYVIALCGVKRCVAAVGTCRGGSCCETQMKWHLERKGGNEVQQKRVLGKTKSWGYATSRPTSGSKCSSARNLMGFVYIFYGECSKLAKIENK